MMNHHGFAGVTVLKYTCWLSLPSLCHLSDHTFGVQPRSLDPEPTLYPSCCVDDCGATCVIIVNQQFCVTIVEPPE